MSVVIKFGLATLQQSNMAMENSSIIYIMFLFKPPFTDICQLDMFDYQTVNAPIFPLYPS